MKAKRLMIIAIAAFFLVSPLALKMSDWQNPQVSVVNADSSPIKVACVGDSITQDTKYPAYLQMMLGDKYSVGNFGSRESTALLLSWKPYMNQSEFQSAKDFKPNIVVIMLGTNDGLWMLQSFNESFEQDYATLIDSFQQLDSNPQILIAKPPPIFTNSSDLSSTYHSNTIIPKTEDLANKLNLPIINVYETFGDHADYFDDGVHPNSQGAELIASKVYGAISEQSFSTT